MSFDDTHAIERVPTGEMGAARTQEMGAGKTKSMGDGNTQSVGEGATVARSATSPTGSMATPASAQKSRALLFGGIAAVLIAAAAGGWIAFKPKPAAITTGTATTQTLAEIEKATKVQDLLAAANSFARNKIFDMAEDRYIQVLRDLDCSNEEARRGLSAINPTRLQELTAGCN